MLGPPKSRQRSQDERQRLRRYADARITHHDDHISCHDQDLNHDRSGFRQCDGIARQIPQDLTHANGVALEYWQFNDGGLP